MKKLSLNLDLGDSFGISEHPLLCETYFKLINKAQLGSKKYQDVYLSIEVDKFSEKLGIFQQRVLVITNETINLLRKNTFTNKELTLKRRIQHQYLRGVSKSITSTGDFLLHVSQSHDIRLRSELRDQIISSIKEAYLANLVDNVPIFGLVTDEQLYSFLTTREDFENGNTKDLPEDSLRLYEEDLPIEDKDGADKMVQQDVREFTQRYGDFKLVYKRNENDKQISMQDFEIVNLIGKGSISNVYLIKLKSNNQPFAMKCIQRELVQAEDFHESVKLEQDLLIRANNPFFVNLHYSFQSETKMVYIMTFVRGGDLFMHLANYGTFSEEDVKYIIAQLVMAISYLHSYSIVYRDLKLENILMNDTGYISLVDFGISKKLDPNPRVKTYSVRGTPEYMAPEMLNQGGHSFPVDWWALGTIAYEMLIGQAPFFEEDQSLMFKRILKQGFSFPDDVDLSDECKDFIEKLLHKDPTKRLGNKGFQEVIDHPFFGDVDFKKLVLKELDIPYKPVLSEDVFDVSNFEQELTSSKLR